MALGSFLLFVLALVVSPGAAVVLWRVVQLRRKSVTRTAVNHLATIANLNLPLAGALSVAGQGKAGYAGRVLRRMGELVARGMPLSKAVTQAHPYCSPLVASAIAAGEKAGQLPRALADLDSTLGDYLAGSRSTAVAERSYWLYPTALVLVTVSVVASVMIVIIPRFEDIFSDFDAELPAITVSLINWSRSAHIFAAVLASLLSSLVLSAIAASSIVREPGENRFLVLADIYRWVPFLGRPVAFGNGMSLAIRMVRTGLQAGMTLQAATRLAAELRVNVFLRRRWRRFAALLESGTPAPAAAEKSELGEVFAWACRSLERGNADPQVVLDHAADYHCSLALRWWRALSRMAWPAIISVLGCMVGYVVLALFMPLIQLLWSILDTMP